MNIIEILFIIGIAITIFSGMLMWFSVITTLIKEKDYLVALLVLGFGIMLISFIMKIMVRI